MRPNMVVDEMSGGAGVDVNAQDVSGIKRIAEAVGSGAKQQREAYSAQASSEMMYQFQPWFFAVAFAFCFSFVTACPDLANRPRYRRKADAPEVSINKWCRAEPGKPIEASRAQAGPGWARLG